MLTLIPPVKILLWVTVAGSIVCAMRDDDPEECEIASVTVDGVEVKVTHDVVPKDEAGGADAARAADPPKPNPDPVGPESPETPLPPVGDKETIRPTGSGTSLESPMALPEGSGK